MRDRRAFFSLGLHELYQPAYRALCAKLPDHWQPTCGVRTFAEQDRLYQQGRTAPGAIVTRAQAGLSYHNYGLASDWDYFPDGVYTPLTANAPLWAEYLDACLRTGLRCIDWEKPHNELPVKTPIADLLAAFNQGGQEAVNALLAKERVLC